MNDQQNNGFYLREFTEIMLLGSGGFGTVFKALLKSDQSAYAVKKVALESTERKRSYNEVYFLNELNGKENIVEFFGNWFEHNYYRSDFNQNNTHSNAFVQLSTLNSLCSEKLNEILHIKMQLCKMSLTDVIDKLSEYNSKLANSSYYMINPLIFNIALELFAQIVKGLKHFHQNAIIHRDLTPGNILISADNLVKISDLGLAFRGEDDNVYDFQFKYGTHMYRPKEFPIGCYEFGTDLYSVGIIASQLFCVFPLTDEFVENVSGEQSRVICKLIRQLTSHKKRKRGSCESTLNTIEELKLKYNLSCDLETFLNSQ